MKKTTIGILSFFAMLITLTTACKKEYSCKCSGSAFGMAVADTSISLGKTTKKDAKSQCNSYEANLKSAASIAAAFGVTVTVNCDIE